MDFFLCTVLISVKSKYSSGSWNCPGKIKFNKYKKESPFIGKKGWAVNSVVITFECSNHFSPKLSLSFYSSTVELNTVNIVIDVRFILEAINFLSYIIVKI
jgi:hypothetical protein